MHFKNGRAAQSGDPVVYQQPWQGGQFVSGQIFNLRGTETCNCSVAFIVPGGTQVHTCQNVNEMYHAEDALKAVMEAKQS